MDLLRLTGLVVVGMANAGLAIAVLVRNRKSPGHRIFAAAVALIVVWLTAAFLSDQPALQEYALLFNRITMGAAVAMGAVLLYFAVKFPVTTEMTSFAWRLFFFGAAVVAAITTFTPWVVESVQFEEYGTDIVAGPLLWLMAGWTVAGVVAIVLVLAAKYRRIEGREKAQLKYLFFGFGLFTGTSLVFGLLIPMITGSYQLSSLNTFASLFLVGFTAYAMIKHRFMDIRIVALRGAVYLVLLTAMGLVLVLAAVVARAELTQALGIHPDVLFVTVSLGAIIVFQPLKRSLEHFTDKLFYRRTYDPQALLRRVAASMASTLDLSDLEFTLSRELCSGMRLTNAIIAHTIGGKIQVVGGHEGIDEDSLRDLINGCRHSIVFADDPDTSAGVSESLSNMDVRVLIPLVSDGTVLGAILLGPKLSGEMFTAQDDSFLGILQSEASISVRNALLFEERNQRVRELSALNTLAWALGRDTQFEAVLDRALTEVMQVTGAEAGSIMLFQPDGKTLGIECAHGLPEDVVTSARVKLGEGIAGWVALNRKPLVLVDAQDDGFGQELERQGIRSALSVPLVCKGEVTGVLNVSKATSAEAFSKENLKIVASFAGQLAVAIENARLYVDLENTFLGTIGALAAAVDAKDPYTYGHSSAVTDFAMAIGREMGLSDPERETLRIAALLHDIGKIGIDGTILNKPGKLTPDEYQIIQSHPDIAANILGSLEFLHEVVPLVQYHHEHFGGGGYPAGLAGDEIPLGARIISVADAFDAMTSDRPYRPALLFDEAVGELTRYAGVQFDPVVVDAFLRSHPAPPERLAATA